MQEAAADGVSEASADARGRLALGPVYEERLLRSHSWTAEPCIPFGSNDSADQAGEEGREEGPGAGREQ